MKLVLLITVISQIKIQKYLLITASKLFRRVCIVVERKKQLHYRSKQEETNIYKPYVCSKTSLVLKVAREKNSG